MNAPAKIETSLLGVLAAALADVDAAKKNSANPHFKSNYADLKSVIEAIRPIAKHGLWYRQVSHEAANGVAIETLYIHALGELSAGTVFVPADKNNAHGYGSAQSYARRYGLQMAFGLATEDDDGNAAVAAPPATAKREPAHSALKTELRGFVREMESCGDWDTWVALRESKDGQRLIKQCRDNLPAWWETGEGLPDEFVPLRRRIELLEANLSQQIADYATA